MVGISDLQREKNELIARMEELRSVSDAEWTAEHDANFNEVCDDIESKTRAIQELEEAKERKAAAADRHQAVVQGIKDSRKLRFRPESPYGVGVRADDPEVAFRNDQQHRRNVFNGYLRSLNNMDLLQRHHESAEYLGIDLRREGLHLRLPTSDNYRGFGAFTSGGGGGLVRTNYNDFAEGRDIDLRAQSVGTDAAGGYTVPVGFLRELERAMLAFGGMRRVARIIQTAGDSPLHVPVVDDTSNSAAILAEAGAIVAADPTYSEVILDAYKYSSFTLVSQELLEDSAFDVSTMMASMLGERIGRGTATHFANGDGSSKPRGVTVAAPIGKTAATATFTFDEILDLIHSVDPAYRADPSCGFVFNDTTLLAMRKLKDGENRYYWQPGTVSSEPDRLFGFPYVVDQAFLDAATTVEFAVFGAMNKYMIRDQAAFRFYRLDELYRANDQVGFAVFSRHDGDLIDAGTNPIKAMSVT